MPEDIHSEKRMATDVVTLAKMLFNDISRQMRTTAGLGCVDAANCYDSMVHVIGSLIFQAFGVPEEAVNYMLTAIKEMKYFLRTAYGDSTSFSGIKIEIKFQGLCQGSGAALAG